MTIKDQELIANGINEIINKIDRHNDNLMELAKNHIALLEELRYVLDKLILPEAPFRASEDPDDDNEPNEIDEDKLNDFRIKENDTV